MEPIYQKQAQLQTYLQSLARVAVAFSGGVDSTFLLKTAHDVLGDRVMAITARSASFPARELSEATQFVKMLGIRHVVCDTDELEIEGFCQNPANRCYICKKELFTQMLSLAKRHGAAYLAEGSNMDDLGDYRPGLQAIDELGVKSPLRAASLTKAEIRRLSKEMGLATWDKPSFACLASRFVYGETITREKLRRVELSEQLLLDKGFRQVRVRIHGNLARIELLPEDIQAFMNDPVSREEVHARLKAYGFQYVTVDILGYRTGSMNETLGLPS